MDRSLKIVATLTERALRELERDFLEPKQQSAVPEVEHGAVSAVSNTAELAAYALLRVLRFRPRARTPLPLIKVQR